MLLILGLHLITLDTFQIKKSK